MGELIPVSSLELDDIFSFTTTTAEDAVPANLERLRCTGVMPVSGRNVRNRGGLRGDQYSVYFKPHPSTPDAPPTAKRIPWNAKVVRYAGKL